MSLVDSRAPTFLFNSALIFSCLSPVKKFENPCMLIFFKLFDLNRLYTRLPIISRSALEESIFDLIASISLGQGYITGIPFSSSAATFPPDLTTRTTL